MKTIRIKYIFRIRVCSNDAKSRTGLLDRERKKKKKRRESDYKNEVIMVSTFNFFKIFLSSSTSPFFVCACITRDVFCFIWYFTPSTSKFTSCIARCVYARILAVRVVFLRILQSQRNIYVHIHTLLHYFVFTRVTMFTYFISRYFHIAS